MEKLRKLFYQTPMPWWKVLLLAAAAGVYTGTMMLIPALKDTSFQDIGITLEYWFFFALLVILNCEKPTEAALKVFVFFLVSQPLVYLTMWGQYHRFPWEYYRYWFFWTLATLPGGFLAWQVKRQKWYSAVILALACAYELFTAANCFWNMPGHFPHKLLTALATLAMGLGFVPILLEDQKHRILAWALAVLLGLGLFAANQFSHGAPETLCMMGEGATYALADEDLVTAERRDYALALVGQKSGQTTLTVTEADGSVTVLTVTVMEDKTVEIEEISD